MNKDLEKSNCLIESRYHPVEFPRVSNTSLFSNTNEIRLFVQRIGILLKNTDLEQVIFQLNLYYPNIFIINPKLLLSLYKCIIFDLLVKDRIDDARRFYLDRLYPIYDKPTLKQKHEIIMSIISSDKIRAAQTKSMIQSYMLRFLRLLENLIYKNVIESQNSPRAGDGFRQTGYQQGAHAAKYDNSIDEMELSEFEEEIAKTCKNEEKTKNILNRKKRNENSHFKDEARNFEKQLNNYQNIQKFHNFIENSQNSETFKILDNFNNLNIDESITSSKNDDDVKMDIDDQDQEHDQLSFCGTNERICSTSQINRTCSSNQYDIQNDPSSNLNFYKKTFVPKSSKAKEKLKNKVPFLKSFNPKFLKKENIDKKILRKFRNYIKSNYKRNLNIFENYDLKFWKDFSENNLLPPMNYHDCSSFIEFKSFNTKYMVWLFKKKGATDLYSKFAEIFGLELLQSFIEDYKLINNKDEPDIIEKLKYYIMNMHEIYSTKTQSSNQMDTETLSNHPSNYTITQSEELYDSIIGPDINQNSQNSLNIFNILKDFNKPSIRKCGHVSYDMLNNEYNSHSPFITNLNNSLDSIASVD